MTPQYSGYTPPNGGQFLIADIRNLIDWLQAKDPISSRKWQDFVNYFDPIGKIAGTDQCSLYLGGAGSLDIKDNQLETILIALQCNTIVTNLDLSYRCIGILSDLSYQWIGKTLCVNTTLTQLDLYHNQLSDKGVQFLTTSIIQCHGTVLQSLSLGSNMIGDIGAEALAFFLQNNETVQKIDLFMNDIGVKGAEKLAIALMNNTTLISLNLSACSYLDSDFGLADFPLLDDPDFQTEESACISTRINNSLVRNGTLALEAFWTPKLQGRLFPMARQIILSSLLCGTQLLPEYLWVYIFSFWKRPDFILVLIIPIPWY